MRAAYRVVPMPCNMRIFIAFQGRLRAELRSEIIQRVPPQKRDGFEVSRYKSMNIKDLETVNLPPSPGRRRRSSRRVSNPTFAEALFGVVCVIGVFAMLAVLYSFR
ncbi:hypothetical protein [Acidocella sp.]|uniref:hypothetical protein n=1 Tax=Acidocella sp. TaxID=50710 RepID=UPI002603D94C|nr:hypothetical protein [Acidocella sp.]MDD2795750.1 hypothetical protein [Acidocella sp.]